MDYIDMPMLVPDDVSGIIFDYGGTLDSHGDHWSHIILEAYIAAGLEPEIEDFVRAYIYGERQLAQPGAVDPSDTFLDLMRKKIEAECSQLDPQPDAATREAIARHCYESARSCTAEARPMLEKLAQDYPLVLVSNFYGNLEAVITDFGLAEYFKAVIESARVGVCKPDPAIFRLGVEALGLPPEEILVIGDSMDKDILPAASLGCRTLLIDAGPGPLLQKAWCENKGTYRDAEVPVAVMGRSIVSIGAD